MVIVYTKPGCQPCRLTKNKLADLGVPFEERDVTVGTFADELVALGSLQLPTILDTSTGEHWSGLVPARLYELASVAA